MDLTNIMLYHIDKKDFEFDENGSELQDDISEGGKEVSVGVVKNEERRPSLMM